MALVKVGTKRGLPPGGLLEVVVGEDRYAICNVDGELHAVEGICPHRSGPLGQGALHGHMLVCPWHAWEFDCRSGENDYNPELKLRKFPVHVEGEDVLIDIS